MEVIMIQANDIKDDNALWKKYFETKDLSIRNQIIDRYSYIVKIIAMRIRGVYQQYGDVDDIVNEGIIALIDAIGRFDLSKDIKFETYATIRVKGAIIDYVRKQAWTPRRVNKNKKLVENAEKELSISLGRSPSELEISNYLKIDVSEYNKIILETSNSSLLSFEDLISEVTYKNLSSSSDLSPEDSYAKKELEIVLADAIEKLSEKEKLIISLYYKEELRLKDIAGILQISNSRASQIHSQALLKLNDNIKKYIKE
ncbi:MAG TPA: FliA/WhiG family RNA polymerase sigma factor [Clostridiales bacterium]|nr:FliA/WhiG family RNA polymerase sigma factor [Clostridiales bacterium]